MKSPSNKQRTILASGGVLWSRCGGKPCLALVRRVKYGDWTLPKGKLKRGETFERAAIREVKEETGCSPRMREFVGLVQYMVGTTPKVVLFWNMECSRPVPYSSNDEISKIVWLSPASALRRMTYAGDRRILRASMKLRP